MVINFFSGVVLFLVIICFNNEYDSSLKSIDKSKVAKEILSISKREEFEKTEIICDSIYKNKIYKLTLTNFDTIHDDPDIPNTIFDFYKITNGKQIALFEDTVYCEMQEIRFDDFNEDGLKEILVKNNADVRDNWTYYLYLVDTTKDRLIRIRGFEEIKNPNYLSKYNLIDNYVMSGKNWTSFYKIQGDSIKDFDIVIYDDQRENGTYDQQHKKAINSILKKSKNN